MVLKRMYAASEKQGELGNSGSPGRMALSQVCVFTTTMKQYSLEQFITNDYDIHSLPLHHVIEF